MWSKDTIERFWSKVEVRGEDDCWEWQGAKNGGGYGSFLFNGKPKNAHRIAYLFDRGYLPEDKDICHSCDNKSCCNPYHLWAGTVKDDMDDMRRKGREPLVAGSRNPFSKLSEEDVKEIRRLVNSGISGAEVGRKYGIGKSNVSHIVLYRSWKHVP